MKGYVKFGMAMDDVVDAPFGLMQFDPVHFGRERTCKRYQLQLGDELPRADVAPKAKGKMGFGVTGDVKAVGIVELALIAVGCAE